MTLLSRLIRALISLAFLATTPPAEAVEAGAGPERAPDPVNFAAVLAGG